MFIYEAVIFLHHTDAAGRLFFANQFYLMHEAKEKFLEHVGLPIGVLLEDPRYTFPLVHAEADFKVMLRAGDRVRIGVKVEKIGNTSVIFGFTLTREDGTPAGSGRTVNVCVEKSSGQKATLPQGWRRALEAVDVIH